MKLNLGCGRVIFPLERGKEPYGRHLFPLADTVYEPGWVNVDKYANDGVNEVVDLFKFPWIRSSNGSPWNDDSVDEIWAAHILEHVPHQVRPTQYMPSALANEYHALCNDYDGFFVFMYECWRILKPNGLIHIRAPFGVSYPSINDPTHTRYMTPGTFGYLAGQDDGDEAPFDYNLPMRFEVVLPVSYRFQDKWTSEMSYLNDKGIERVIRMEPSVADEFRLTLRAIKE